MGLTDDSSELDVSAKFKVTSHKKLG